MAGAPAPQPAAAPPPTYGQIDWNSLDMQPGETALDSWIVALFVNGRADVTGSLTVTDRRVLFKPQVAGSLPLVMVASALSGYTDRHGLALLKDQIVQAHGEKGLINHKLVVTMADGAVFAFNRSLMSVDPIVAAIQRR